MLDEKDSIHINIYYNVVYLYSYMYVLFMLATYVTLLNK